ncbi:MAG: epoxyqueuosine reductase [Candidatus Hydrogenedentota bacterium]
MQTRSPRLCSLSVKDAAKANGFDACGIAAARDIDPDDRLGQWLANGYHADMAWMANTREVRQNVQRKLPGAKSVVVVARNYYAQRPGKPEGAGRVSRYAWGRDYHNVLRKPLRRIAEHIQSLSPMAETYCCIDSGPVMEKAWAMQAGLGWIGKNSLVLRKGLGSWFFLGVVLTTLELEPDAPATDQCGACRLCIDACPTEALVDPRTVDATKCISYHTIENRGEIPQPIRERMKDWVFGCDICQEVCPWNRRPVTTTESDFLPRESQAHLTKEGIVDMDEKGFLNRFAGTPLMRAKLHGLVRNLDIIETNTPLQG